MLPFLLTLRNVEALHASAIVVNEIVYAFCAPSGTGKSTLAFACARRGYDAWADDALLLSIRGHMPHALSLPFCLREAKRQPSWASGKGDQEYEPGLAVLEKFDPLGGLSLPLGGVFVVERCAEDGSVQPALELLTPVESLPLLLANAYAFTTLLPDRRRTLASHYLDLAAAVPVYRLRLPNDLTLLDSAIRLVERAIDEG